MQGTRGRFGLRWEVFVSCDRQRSSVCLGAQGRPTPILAPRGEGCAHLPRGLDEAQSRMGQGLNVQERSELPDQPSALDGFRGWRRGALKQQHPEAAGAALRQQLMEVRCCCLGGGSGACQDHREEASVSCAASGTAPRGPAPSPSASRLAPAAERSPFPGGKGRDRGDPRHPNKQTTSAGRRRRRPPVEAARAPTPRSN